MRVEQQNKFIEVLDFLKNYANKTYKSPEREMDIIEKNKLEDIRNKGKNAVSTFKDMYGHFEDEDYKNSRNPKWLSVNGSKVRGGFWSELKRKDKIDLPSSISIIANKNKEIRFAVYIELKFDNATKQDYLRHNRFLDILDIDKEDFDYFATESTIKDGIDVNNASKDEIKNYINNIMDKETGHICVGKSFNYDFIKQHTSEEIINFMKDTVNKLKK